MQDNNGSGTALTVKGPGGGQTVPTGTWTALDPATGGVFWQVADPAMTKPLSGVTVNGPVTVVNGVMFGGSMDAAGPLYALDAAAGGALLKVTSRGTLYGGPAQAEGMGDLGCGHPRLRAPSAHQPP